STYEVQRRSCKPNGANGNRRKASWQVLHNGAGSHQADNAGDNRVAQPDVHKDNRGDPGGIVDRKSGQTIQSQAKGSAGEPKWTQRVADSGAAESCGCDKAWAGSRPADLQATASKTICVP